MSKLIIIEGESSREIAFTEGASCRIGRGKECEAAITDARASREHARLHWVGEAIFLTDLGSSNGTSLNGRPLRAHEDVPLAHMDRIMVGSTTIVYSNTDAALNQSFNDITDSDVLEVKLLKKVLRAMDKEVKPSLQVVTGVAEGKRFILEDDFDEGIIGRDPTTDFMIEEYVISRRHSKIEKRPEGFYIKDLDSKNGTYLNNTAISEARLKDGDRISLGTIVMIFRNPNDVNLDDINRTKAPVKRPKRAKLESPSDDPMADLPDQPLGYPTTEDNPAEEEVSETGSAAASFPEIPDLEEDYPLPQLKRGFTLMEWGFMGLGALVFFVAVILLVNVLSS